MGLDGSKTKLKDADINKVDFVPAGAQQHSRIALFKSEQGIISKITDAIAKAMSGFKVVPMDDVPEEPETFTDELAELKQRRAKDAVMCEVWDYTHAFHETVESIICSESTDKSDLIQGAIDQFGAAVISALPNWVQGNSVMKIGKKISTQRMESLKACMVQLANLIAEAESEPAVQHQVGDGVAQPADKSTEAPAESGGQVDNPAGKDTSTGKPNPKAEKPKNDEGSGKNMAEINKSALPQDVQDYITELEGKVVKAAPASTEPEDIYKGLPEGVAKMLKEQAVQLQSANEQIAKMRDDSDTKVFIAKAAELTGNLGVSAEEFGPVLKSINAASPELATKIEAVLKAANEAVAKGDLFKEAGAEAGSTNPTGVAKSDAWAQIETLASNMVAKGETKTQAEAIAKAMESPEGRRLYAIYTGKIKG